MQSCDKTQDFDRDGLTFKDKLSYNNEFRLDGMYIEKTEDYTRLFYFYKNGTVFHGGINDLPTTENECFSDINHTRNWPTAWGWYIIDNNIIKVQTYDPVSVAAFNELRIMEIWFRIENETELTLFRRKTALNEVINDEFNFNFQYCYPKPDSTNILMD